MNHLKSILAELHGKNKKLLWQIYLDRHVWIEGISSSEQPVEEERIFSYHGLDFQFVGTGSRHPERMNLFIFIPEQLVDEGHSSPCVPVEDYLLRTLSPRIARLSKALENSHKDSREKARFESQSADSRILRRSGLMYDEKRQAFLFRILFFMPLINGTIVNGKSGFKAVRSILEEIRSGLEGLDKEALKNHIRTYVRQTEIQNWLMVNHKTAFIANGSILPRQGDSERPLPEAVSFVSPKDLEAVIPFSDGEQIRGMAISEGVTIITGGGYSGKSTLLNALEAGIYHHVPGDGREFVLSLPDSVKIYAEDGRPVHAMDLSLFFKEQSSEQFFHSFSTAYASGSVSQAANILEAIYAGSRLLLIDEDSSATNFMIRDSLMRRLVEKEPIIPFTDRARPIYDKAGVSTILVIGGSGEYLKQADVCLLMEDYRIRNVTEQAKALAKEGKAFYGEALPGVLPLLGRRYLKRSESALPFHIGQCISVDKARYIQIDDYTSDVTRLTAIGSEDQLHTLACLLECFLDNREGEISECREMAICLAEQMFETGIGEKIQAGSYQFTLWLEEVRPMDLLAALFRMRGVEIFS